MSKLTLVTFSFFVLFISSCSDANSCEGAKNEFIKNFILYLKSVRTPDGKGASVPGLVESTVALKLAQINCGKPDLTFEDILKEKNLTFQDLIFESFK